MNEKPDMYESVTNAIIQAIEEGQTADKFQMPWTGTLTMPTNAITKKTYRGINIPVLWMYQEICELTTSTWGTYKQWQELGAQVKKGSKGTRIVFWKILKGKEKDKEADPVVFAKSSTVFNADQVEGYEIPEIKTVGTAEQIENVDKFVNDTKAVIKENKERAYYNPSKDVIGMPLATLFYDTQTSNATEAYYSTLLHELTHWTGAKHRLNRLETTNKKKEEYAFEELIAELGAAMLCAMLGVTSSTRADHAQYIDSWLKALKNDQKLIFSAASKAQKAVDYLHSLLPTENKGEKV